MKSRPENNSNVEFQRMAWQRRLCGWILTVEWLSIRLGLADTPIGMYSTLGGDNTLALTLKSSKLLEVGLLHFWPDSQSTRVRQGTSAAGGIKGAEDRALFRLRPTDV